MLVDSWSTSSQHQALSLWRNMVYGSQSGFFLRNHFVDSYGTETKINQFSPSKWSPSLSKKILCSSRTWKLLVSTKERFPKDFSTAWKSETRPFWYIKRVHWNCLHPKLSFSPQFTWFAYKMDEQIWKSF